jgi:hypothetical protein
MNDMRNVKLDIFSTTDYCHALILLRGNITNIVY